MKDDRRLDFDAADDLGLNKDLLKDVIAATEHAKKRVADDKAQEQKQQTQAKDRKSMVIIVSIAAVVIVAVAFWMIFMRQSSAQQSVKVNAPVKRQTLPVQQPMQQAPIRDNAGYVQPMQNRPSTQNNQPRPVVSDPVRPNSSDTYAEPQDTGGGM